MDHIQATSLDDRTLWYDGDFTVKSEDISKYIGNRSLSGRVFVDDITEEIQNYNRLVGESEQIKKKESLQPFDLEWNIPEEYKTIDVEKYLIDRLNEEIEERGWARSDERSVERELRVAKELSQFKKLKLFNVIRVLIYIINKLESTGVVWGIGRGSSVSSYILYLIKVHDIDSVEFDLNVKDFLHS